MCKRDGHPDIADEAPCEGFLTPYDHAHVKTYLRLLDAAADGAEWSEAALIVLGVDANREPGRAWRAYETHLARARWLAAHGYEKLIRSGLH